MSMETRKIEVEGKINRRHAEKIVEKDQEMIRKALEVEGIVIRDLAGALKAIEVLVGFGLLMVDEAVEMSLHIKGALSVFGKRDDEETAKRVADFGAKRIAEKIGGEVVEGGEDNAEG
jgi:hypothetical protein